MNLHTLTALLNSKKEILDSLDYAYTFLNENLDFKAFSCAEDVERYANSKGENVEQIVLKKFNGKKSLFVVTDAYNAIVVYDGQTFVTSRYRLKQKTQPIDPDCKIDYTNVKEELLRLFAEANEDTKKLAS